MANGYSPGVLTANILDGTAERVFVLRRPNISATTANNSTPVATPNTMTTGPKGFCPNGILAELFAARSNAAMLYAAPKVGGGWPEEAVGGAEADSDGATDQEELEKAM